MNVTRGFTGSLYSLLLLAGIGVSLALWSRLARRDERLLIIYFAALVSAFLGAKLIYLAAEGWMFWGSPDRWMIWATGKTILGALLGGYAGVELAKKLTGYTQPTGDWFALVAPVGIGVGRVGCLLHGCCLGQVCTPHWWTLADAQGLARWPAAPVEIGFNVIALGVFLTLRRRGLLPDQHFHLYLIGYGSFRFAHEFLRATPRTGLGLTGYQMAALAVAGLGVVSFVRRRVARHGRRALAVTLAFWVGVPSGMHAQERPLASLALEEVLERLRAKHDLPALAAAAVRGVTVSESAAVGARKLGGAERVTLDDRWHIGSCTKSMTATLAALFVQRGELKWATTVGATFPELRDSMDPQWAAVTIEQLLTHRGGAPANAPGNLWRNACMQQGTPPEQRLQFVRGLLLRRPEAEPGAKFIYSNQGYAVAGAMLERISGEPWEGLMRTLLFSACGMSGAGFGAPASVGKVDQPWGHRRAEGSLTPVPPGREADNPPAIGPAGTVHCTIEELARYAAWHGRGHRSGTATLKRDGFLKLHTPVNGGDYAMGWAAAPRLWAGGEALTHAGSNTMFFAVIWIAPARDRAFVAAANCAGENAAKACDEAVSALIGRAETLPANP